ncbi:unnamed protein product [Somion occarium]|uniref:Prolyl 4-hydroxylase alpha subunit Fe(2+) 2OG dioxygenase domain-containing protein n=1 Tax=Somion occarium TaxID=3059160 RepID=A0ABP1DMR2_9APHY
MARCCLVLRPLACLSVCLMEPTECWTQLPTIEQLESIKAAFVNKPPYCSGTLRLPPDCYVLYFGKEKISHRLDFANVDDEILKKLAETCDVATFGLNKKDVLDESYRKAGKLDSKFFAPKLDFDSSGLREIIRDDLLEGPKAKENIRAELYKLNVYGPGSFFKPHKDTPRSKNMFGSLVLIYPTIHEGGSLIIRDGDSEWCFDSARAVNDTKEPEIGYVIFYSDVEHEVAEVISGYRVTITYILYFEPPMAATTHTGLAVHGTKLRGAFRGLLADPAFLPNGGHLGFGLHRGYALDLENRSLDYVVDCLKGSDATLLQVCRDLGLLLKFYVVFDDEGSVTICDKLPSMENDDVEVSVAYHLRKYYGGKIIERDADDDSYRGRSDNEDGNSVDMKVYWVNEVTKHTQVKDSYIAYGNESFLAFVYGYGCVIVDVGPYGSRNSDEEDNSAT